MQPWSSYKWVYGSTLTKSQIWQTIMLWVYEVPVLFICSFIIHLNSHLNFNRLWTNGLLSKPCRILVEMSRMSRSCWTILPLTWGIQIRFSFSWDIFNFQTCCFLSYNNSLCSWSSGLLANWRILWVPCELPCKRRVRIQILGWSCCATWQNKPSGLLTNLLFLFLNRC